MVHQVLFCVCCLPLKPLQSHFLPFVLTHLDVKGHLRGEVSEGTGNGDSGGLKMENRQTLTKRKRAHTPEEDQEQRPSPSSSSSSQVELQVITSKEREEDTQLTRKPSRRL